MLQYLQKLTQASTFVHLSELLTWFSGIFTVHNTHTHIQTDTVSLSPFLVSGWKHKDTHEPSREHNTSLTTEEKYKKMLKLSRLKKNKHIFSRMIPPNSLFLQHTLFTSLFLSAVRKVAGLERNISKVITLSVEMAVLGVGAPASTSLR